MAVFVPIVPLDILIAAHAASLGAALINNTCEVEHVPGIEMEDWVSY